MEKRGNSGKLNLTGMECNGGDMDGLEWNRGAGRNRMKEGIRKEGLERRENSIDYTYRQERKFI